MDREVAPVRANAQEFSRENTLLLGFVGNDGERAILMCGSAHQAAFWAFSVTSVWYLRFSFALTPLQQFYLPYYLRTEVAGVMHKTDKYQLLVVADAHGLLHLAGDNELQEGRTIVPSGKPLAFELTPSARTWCTSPL